MKYGKKILAAIICGLLFVTTGCQATTERLNAGGEMRIDVDLDNISYPQTTQDYEEAFWQGNEEKLCELFLSGKPAVREVYAEGPAYHVRSSSGESEESLLFNDWWEEFKTGTPSKAVSGFRYFRGTSSKSVSGMYQSMVSYGQFGRNLLTKLSTDELSFGAMEEYQKQADELMEQTGLAENFQLSMAGAFTADALNKLDLAMGTRMPDTPPEFGQEDENYMFYYESAIDSASVSYVIIIYDGNGLLEIEAFNAIVQGAAQGDAYEPCSPRDALRVISGGYEEGAILVGAEFTYMPIEKKTVLEGVWRFTILEEFESPEDGRVYYQITTEYVRARDQQHLADWRNTSNQVQKDLLDTILY